jgi:hypothetical protein
MTEVSDDPRALLRARFAAARDALTAPAADSSTQDDPAPLSTVQRRLWFLAQRDPDSAAYHVPLVFRLTGPLDEPALLGALRGLASRHRVLRGVIDGDTIRFASPDSVPVSVVDITEPVLAAALNTEAARPFALTDAPPMRAVLFRVDLKAPFWDVECRQGVLHDTADGPPLSEPAWPGWVGAILIFGWPGRSRFGCQDLRFGRSTRAERGSPAQNGDHRHMITNSAEKCPNSGTSLPKQ